MPKNARWSTWPACALVGLFLAKLCAAGPAEADELHYLLALSWQPAFCAFADDAEECEATNAFSDDPGQFTLHGLWPNWDSNEDGQQDEDDTFCLPEERRMRIIERDRRNWALLDEIRLPHDLELRLAQAMPGVASYLDRHQWFKHGSCSGLSEVAYFATAVDLTEVAGKAEIARVVRDHGGGHVERNRLISAFEQDFGPGSGGALRLICRKSGNFAYLAEIRIRLRKDWVEDQPHEGIARKALSLPEHNPAGNCPRSIFIDRFD